VQGCAPTAAVMTVRDCQAVAMTGNCVTQSMEDASICACHGGPPVHGCAPTAAVTTAHDCQAIAMTANYCTKSMAEACTCACYEGPNRSEVSYSSNDDCA
jgi:hypothetical protein